MADKVYPEIPQLAAVLAVQVPFVTGKVKLTKSLIPLSKDLVKADCAAIECDYTGYAAKTLSALPAPFADPTEGGVSFIVPTQTFAMGSPVVTGNDVYGLWMEDSAGDILFALNFAAPWSMQEAGDALPVSLLLNFFGSGVILAICAGHGN